MSVNNHRLTVRTNIIVLSSTHHWVDGVKFIARAKIPDVLPFFKTKLGMQGIKSYAGSFICVMGKDRADLAAASAFSLPGMLT